MYARGPTDWWAGEDVPLSLSGYMRWMDPSSIDVYVFNSDNFLKFGSSFVFILVTFINSWKRAVAQLIQNKYRNPMISHPKIKTFEKQTHTKKGRGNEF